MIKFEDPERTWIIGDPHWNHLNIIKNLSSWSTGGQRDFNSVEHMNEFLWKVINDKVKEDDVLIINGDFSFGGPDKIRAARAGINCKNIHLVVGNHDDNVLKHKDLQQLFTAVYGSFDYDVSVHFRVGKNDYMIGHYAGRTWRHSGKGFRQLFGHSHGHLIDDPKALAFDTGFDVHKSPLSFIEVEEIISRKTYQSVDHH